MDRETCINCGNPNPEHILRFVGVNVHSTSSTSYSGRKQITTTTTTEQFTGAKRAGFCEDCIKKKRLGLALGEGAAGLFGGTLASFFLALFLFSKTINDHAGVIALSCLGIGLVIGVIVFLVEMKKETPLVAAKILEKKERNNNNGIRFIPVDRSVYVPKNAQQPDLQTFQSKTGLKTNVGGMVFVQFIATGLGDAIVDQMLLQAQQPEQSPAAPVEVPSQPGE